MPGEYCEIVFFNPGGFTSSTSLPDFASQMKCFFKCTLSKIEHGGIKVLIAETDIESIQFV